MSKVRVFCYTKVVNGHLLCRVQDQNVWLDSYVIEQYYPDLELVYRKEGDYAYQEA